MAATSDALPDATATASASSLHIGDEGRYRLRPGSSFSSSRSLLRFSVLDCSLYPADATDDYVKFCSHLQSRVKAVLLIGPVIDHDSVHHPHCIKAFFLIGVVLHALVVVGGQSMRP